jgi:hypothetical protein
MQTPVPPNSDAEFLARRRRRSVALAVTLFVLVAIFYALSIVKMGIR